MLRRVRCSVALKILCSSMTTPSQGARKPSLMTPIDRLCANADKLAPLVFKAQLFTRNKRSRPIQGGIFRLEYDRLRYAPTPRREGIESPGTSNPGPGPRLRSHYSGVVVKP
jgi:hypothetical protein